MAAHDENLDDVIASLIDSEKEEASATAQEASPDNEEEIEPGQESIELTERAARQILKIRSDESLDEELCLRVAVEGGGCSGLNYRLGFDLVNEDDRRTRSQGIDIVVDPRHLIYLNGIVIDYPDGLDARGFTFENPNASENCGCGASFAV